MCVRACVCVCVRARACVGVGSACCMQISMKLDILHVTTLSFLPVVGCTLECCTEIPTRTKRDYCTI